MRLWTAAHAIDDMYQGLVPASVPYFVLDRHYSYVAASGLALAATLGSSLPQPVIGLLVDKWRLGWMAAAGVGLAGVGAGLSGLAPAYPMVWLLLLASGLGVAMFHPAAGTSARADAGGSASAMSIFAAGGSAGFFLAPVLATPALVSRSWRHRPVHPASPLDRAGPAPPPAARPGQRGTQIHRRRA